MCSVVCTVQCPKRHTLKPSLHSSCSFSISVFCGKSFQWRCDSSTRWWGPVSQPVHCSFAVWFWSWRLTCQSVVEPPWCTSVAIEGQSDWTFLPTSYIPVLQFEVWGLKKWRKKERFSWQELWPVSWTQECQQSVPSSGREWVSMEKEREPVSNLTQCFLSSSGAQYWSHKWHSEIEVVQRPSRPLLLQGWV